MSAVIDDGGLITKDPSDVRTYTFDWDDELNTAVTIVTSTWTITPMAPSTDTSLVKDSAAILVGSRMTQIRLSAGVRGATYRIDNAILTSESPTQTIERSFFLRVEDQ